LVRAEGEKALESHYFHSMKQGLFLEHGGSAKAMALEADDQQRLWTSLMACDKVMFASVDKSLRREQDPVSIPVRVVVKGNPIVIQPNCRAPYPTMRQFLDKYIVNAGGDSTSKENTTSRKGNDDGQRDYLVLCHGVEIEEEAPLVEVWASLHHPDHFLYISVVPRIPSILDA
jgi:hypothetical protein